MGNLYFCRMTSWQLFLIGPLRLSLAHTDYQASAACLTAPHPAKGIEKRA